MALKGPSQEDLRKIHAEVNQLVNQRFLLTTIAISVFGVVLGWFIAKPSPAAGMPLGWLYIAGALLLLVLLFLLFFCSHLSGRMLRVYSTYLIVTKSSAWEKDWAEYRKEKYWAYTKPQTIIFMMLGFIAGAFPVLLVAFSSLLREPLLGLIILLVVGLIYEILVCLMGFCDLWSNEKTAQDRWEKLNK